MYMLHAHVHVHVLKPSPLMQRDATLEASKAAVRARAYAHAAAQEARTVKARLARLAKQKDPEAALHSSYG